MDRWLTEHGHLGGAVKDEPSQLSSNWFPITSLRSLIRYVGTPVGRSLWVAAIKSSKRPYVVAGMRLAVTFAEPSAIQIQVAPDIPIKTEYEMPSQAFMAGKSSPKMPMLKSAEVWRIVVDMLRQGWRGICAISCGLMPHEMTAPVCPGPMSAKTLLLRRLGCRLQMSQESAESGSWWVFGASARYATIAAVQCWPADLTIPASSASYSHETSSPKALWTHRHVQDCCTAGTARHSATDPGMLSDSGPAICDDGVPGSGSSQI